MAADRARPREAVKGGGAANAVDDGAFADCGRLIMPRDFDKGFL